MVVLGKASDARVERDLKYNQGSSILILLMYSEELSHMLYVAADMVLVPSVYEPCGLAQIIGMCYGAVHIIIKTGGLANTVFDMDENSQPKLVNGFVFEGIDEGSLNWELDRAFSYYRKIGMNSFIIYSGFVFDPAKWPQMEMDEDFLKLSKMFDAMRSVFRVPTWILNIKFQF